MKAKKAAVAAILGATLLLTACGGGGGDSILLKTNTVTLPDGRHVVCVRYIDGGVTCDWEALRNG